MTSTSTERHSVISHTIGPKGTLVLRTVRGSVRVLGVDGDDAHVEARYPASAAGPDDDVLHVTRRDDRLEIEVDDTDSRRTSHLARLFGDGRPRVDFDVRMPRTATLRLSGVSADMDVTGLDGIHELRTVSGDLRISDMGGSLSLQSVSGDASVTGTDLKFQASTTSGDLAISATLLRAVHVRTVSGDLRMAGALDAAETHALESISGDVELLPASGVTISMTSVSGSLHSSGMGRVDQSRGHGSLVVGDGAARLTFRTMSGDLDVRPPDSAPSSSAAADAPAAARASLPSLPAMPALPQRPAPPAPPRPPAPAPPHGPDSAPPDATDSKADELDVLRALERGEIDVATATRMLEENGNA